jgi:hypothetical protein
MKRTLKALVVLNLLLVAVFAFLLIPGCASPNPAAAPVFPTFTTNVIQTNVMVMVTNLTIVQTPPPPTQTNIVWLTNVTVMQTNLTIVQTNVTTNLPPLNTNAPYLPNQTGTAIVGYANQAAPFVPEPYRTLLDGLLGLATATMTLVAKKKNDAAVAANATTSQLAASVNAQGPTVAAAVATHAALAQAAPLPSSVATALKGKAV